MAADPTTGVKQAAPPTDFNAVDVVEKSAPVQPKVAPRLPPALPTGPPHPALQQAGFGGSIIDFNARVAAAARAHEMAFGTRATPGVVFDIARSPVPTPAIAGMFNGVPTMQRQAAARQVAPDVPAPALSAADYAKQIVLAGRSGNLDAYMSAHKDELTTLAKDPKTAAKITRALFDANSEKNQALANNAATFDVGAAAKIAGKVALGSTQVASALVHSPGGAYQTGKALYSDSAALGAAASVKASEAIGARPSDWALAHSDVTPTATASIIKAMGHQMAQDVMHPGQNPGFLFLDVLGFASAGYGTAARLSAAGRALTAREGIVAAAKAAATKPRGGTFEIGREGAKENALLSDNPFVAAVQRQRLEKRQKALDFTTINGERVPSGLLSITRSSAAKDWLDENFSFETKIGREADARRRTEHVVNMTIANELEHAAGGSVVQSRALSRIPSPLRKGMTRGEQKAIQVVSWGVTPDEQIAFHQRMIESGIGDAKDHKRQIADLKLAKSALDNPAPRPRFTKALKLTQQVAAESERMRIENLGLSPVTAEWRLAKPGAAVGAEAGTQTYAATGPVEPFYTKLEPRGKQKRGPSDAPGFFPTKPGPFGIPTPRPLAELTHEFTGNSIRAGDFRIDATHLTSEAYARTVRAATVLNEHDRLWKSATDTPRTKFDIPIRDSRTVPDELRKILGSMDEGVFTDKEAALLPSDMQTLIHELYPDADKLPKTAIEGVKWVDGRTIGSANEIPTRPGAAVKLMETFQAPVKAVTLFLRPAYILNALGNAGMIVFHQGFSAVPSMARALHATSSLGEETVRTIDALMGQGRSASYSTAITPRLIQAAASAWNVVTDQAFRRSSFIYEARRLGYKTPEQIQELVRGGGKDLVEVKRRANKSMVEFDNLTPFEKNTLRHVIFVYPWVSRSAVWSLRSVMEHPLKTDALAQLGELDENSDPIFAHAPEWFKRVGYFPVGWNNDGTPKLVNPTSVNSFSTLGDMTAILGAGLGGTKYAAFSDLLGPGGQFLQHAITGKDDYGNAYPDKQWLRAAASVLTGLPQVTAYGRGGKKDPNVRPIDVTNRQSAISSFNSNLKRTVFSPGWLNGYGSILAGGLSPRGADLQALEARYWKDATPEQRLQFEVTLLDKAVTLQGGLLKEKVPGRVRQAVALGSDIDFSYKQFAKDHGRQPTTKERSSLLIDYLDGKGLMPDGEAATFKKQLGPLVAESDINHLRGVVFGKYGGGDALKQWDADVRLVASFKKDVFQQKTASLYQQGLVKSPVPGASQEDLYAYGRKYLDFTRKVNGIREQIKAGNATTADLRAFEDANDKSVNGLPSFARTAWSYLKPEDQQKAIASSAVASWSSLTSMEKELLGRPSDARVTAGWAKLSEVVAQQRQELARKGEPFPSGYKRILAKYVEKTFNAPGLVQDFDFANKPLYERLGSVKPIQQSKNADQWRSVLDVAAKYAKYLKSPDYSKSQVRQMWRDYVAKTLQPWVEQDKGFAAEVDQYGQGLLDHLLS